MKNYFKGFLLLGFSLVLMVVLVVQSNKALNASNEKILNIKKESKIRYFNYKSIEDKLNKNKININSVNDFSKRWDKYLEKSLNAPEVLNDIVGLSFRNTVAVSEKSVQRSHLEIDGVKESIILSLKVIGKFQRIYAWLGEVESTYPHAKIVELEFTSENRNTALKLGIILPIMK